MTVPVDIPMIERRADSHAEHATDATPGRRTLRVASICTLFPTIEAPHKGIFVARRVSHLARHADVRALQPVPWFPILRKLGTRGWSDQTAGLRVYRQRMFYIPGALKQHDGRWLSRSILPILKQWRDDTGLDLIDAHFGYPEGVGAAIAARELGLPLFATLRGNEHVYLGEPALRPQLLDALNACTGIITVSHKLRDAVVEAGVDADRIRVIPNSVDRGQFSPGDKSAARAELGLPPDSPVIVSMGQLIFRKGHDTMVRAVAKLRRRHPDVLLVIIGGTAYEPHYPRHLNELIDELQMGPNVRLAGTLPPAQVTRWLHAADLFALCTDREGCCNSVLEALACGLPVVTTEAGDNSVYVKCSENGRLVPFENADATCDALDACLTQNWDPQQISASLPHEGWDGVARSVVEFFHFRLARVAGHSPSVRE